MQLGDREWAYFCLEAAAETPRYLRLFVLEDRQARARLWSGRQTLGSLKTCDSGFTGDVERKEVVQLAMESSNFSAHDVGA